MPTICHPCKKKQFMINSTSVPGESRSLNMKIVKEALDIFRSIMARAAHMQLPNLLMRHGAGNGMLHEYVHAMRLGLGQVFFGVLFCNLTQKGLYYIRSTCYHSNLNTFYQVLAKNKGWSNHEHNRLTSIICIHHERKYKKIYIHGS